MPSSQLLTAQPEATVLGVLPLYGQKGEIRTRRSEFEFDSTCMTVMADLNTILFILIRCTLLALIHCTLFVHVPARCTLL